VDYGRCGTGCAAGKDWPMTKQKEGFCLMRYRDEKTGDIEIVWNSRDGVTPFVIDSPKGHAAQHVDWQLDEYAPFHVPEIGDRVFVRMTLDIARKLAGPYVDRDLEGMLEHEALPNTRDELIEYFAKSWSEDYGGDAPALLVVDKEMRGRFIALKQREQEQNKQSPRFA
jgi:hypothetical protein